MITPDHAQILEDAAIDVSLANALGVYSNTDRDTIPEEGLDYLDDPRGIVFPWVDYLTGQITYQIRLDRPHGKLKYAWPAGQNQKLALITMPMMNQSVHTLPILLIEGIKQALAVYSVLGPDADQQYQILAMAGCYGTSKVDTEGLDDRHVIVILDADVRKNTKVHDAAEGIAHQLAAIGCETRFVISPGTGSQGIDDVLAARKTPSGRKRLLERLIAEASMELPAKPNVVPINRNQREREENAATGTASKVLPNPDVLDEDGKVVKHVIADIIVPDCIVFGFDGNPVHRYEGGVYRELTDSQLSGFIWSQLGDYYQPSIDKPILTEIQQRIRDLGFYPDPLLDQPWLNTPSCLVNLDTGEIIDHTPEIFTTFQIGTEYNPDATCETFDAWLLDMAGDQAQALLEHLAQMLDPSRYPDKHILIEGPPGTGKTTLTNIVRSTLSGGFDAPSPYMTGLSMKDLNAGGFHTKELYGKIFNVAGELESASIEDITEFKKLTGKDQLTVNVKHKDHLTFTSRAVQCLLMNAFPKIKDSDPYFRRMTPFRFENQAGYHKPDSSIERKIRTEEREGVLLRMVLARQATMERGYLLGGRDDVTQRFKGETNPILAWFWSEDNPFDEGWHSSADVYAAYRTAMIALGEDYETQVPFSRAIAAIAGVESDRATINGKRQRAFKFPYRPNVRIPDTKVEDSRPTSVGGQGGETVEQTITQETKIGNPEIQGGPLVTFDLETDSVARMFHGEPHDFFRIGGWVYGDEEDVTISADPFDIPLDNAIPVGQNVIGFDLLALHRAGMYDLERIATGEQLVLDTKIISRQLYPPEAKDTQRRPGPHSLGKLAERHGIEIHKDVLPRLAKEFDTSKLPKDDPGFTGYGEIPLDHPEYREYLGKDVEVTRAVLHAMIPAKPLARMTDPSFVPKPDSMVGYLRREHRLAAIAAMMSNTGIRVDEALLRQRVEALDARRAEMTADLVANYGMPTEGKAPHTSDAGKAALRQAMLDLGMARDGEQPITEKGQLSFSGDAMTAIMDANPGNEPLAELCRLVAELNGQRTLYHTVLAHLQNDGRVHPSIDFAQATGRWSITKPGLTVVGKRGANATEREIFLPDPGHVFLACDFAQVDARCVAAHSQDPEYLKLFFGDHDLHTEVALAVFHDASKRQLAKVVGHGWNYGGSPGALAAQSGADIEDVIAYDEAAKKRFVGVIDWQNQVRGMGEAGELLDNGFGRKLKVDPRRAWTQAPALVGQSCARDIAMESLLRMSKPIRDCARLFIHDELLFAVPENQVDEYRAAILEAMTFEWRGVPFKADSSVPGENWYRCYEK